MRSIVFAWMLGRGHRDALLELLEGAEYLPRDARPRTRSPRTSRLDPKPAARNAREAEGPDAWAKDASLVRRVLEGDRRALDALAARLHCLPRILAAINAQFSGPLDFHELADLAQDVAVILWRKLATFNATSSLETWTYGIASLEYMNALRRKRRTPQPIGEVAFERASGDAPEQTIEDSSALLAALDELDPRDSRVLKRRILEEESFESIAKLEGVPLNTVKARYYRALDRLHRRFGPPSAPDSPPPGGAR